MNDLSKVANCDLLAHLIGRDSARALANKPLAELFGFVPGSRQLNLLGEEDAEYFLHPSLRAAKELFTRCLHERLGEEILSLTSPGIAQAYLCSKIGSIEHEVFWCLWLDSQHRLIAAEEMFRGTVNQTSVYPREIVKRALAVNATAVIFAHNHPSGVVEPSRADTMLTDKLKSALALVDVNVLDHFVVAGNQATSFAERGLL